MPRYQTESWEAGDLSWLGSAHAIWNCQTVTLDLSAFTEGTHYPDGHIRSGQPLQRLSSGLYGPYSGSGTFSGFLFTDQKVVGTADIPAPLLDHGRVKIGKLPVAFTSPTAANDTTTIVYILEVGS
jgi:hypothetical protein